MATPIPPVYRGTPAAQDVVKAFMASDVFTAPDRTPTNPYWSGASWFKYIGIYSRDGLLETKALRAEVAELKALLTTLIAAQAAKEPTQ